MTYDATDAVLGPNTKDGTAQWPTALTEYVSIIETYARMVEHGSADRDLTKDDAAEVTHLLESTAKHLRDKQPTSDMRRVAMSYARRLGKVGQVDLLTVDRAVDILSNL